jgi:hypothetical protein
MSYHYNGTLNGTLTVCQKGHFEPAFRRLIPAREECSKAIRMCMTLVDDHSGVRSLADVDTCRLAMRGGQRTASRSHFMILHTTEHRKGAVL